MTWAEKRPFGEALAALRAEAATGVAAPTIRAGQLQTASIAFEMSVFQPRTFVGHMADAEHHVRTLMDAIRNTSGHQLEPLVVWWSGRRWVVVDGHHRLLAYRRLAADKRRLVVPKVAVREFAGSLTGAIAEATRLNSRDKLPMSKAEKLERSWRLVTMQDAALSKSDIAAAAGVSERTVANMRAALSALLVADPSRDPFTITWDEVLRGRDDGAEVDDKWLDKQAREFARRIAKSCGMKLATNPTLAARTLETYCARLPALLVEEWAEEAVEQAAERRRTDNPDF